MSGGDGERGITIPEGRWVLETLPSTRPSDLQSDRS
jgi:hypothetical protein